MVIGKSVTSKRKVLGFDDDSDGEIEQTVTRHRTKLPKLSISLASNGSVATSDQSSDEPEKNPESNPESVHSDDSEDSYLKMVIRDTDQTAPQRLQPKELRTAHTNGFSFDKISDEHPPKSSMDTSLFGEISSANKNQVMETLENTQLKSKGLSIMEKMGFKVGDTLGKDNRSAEALLQPLKPLLKLDKSGIGRKNEERSSEYVQRQGITTEDTDKYRHRMNQQIIEQKKLSTIHRMQKYCYQFENDVPDILNINAMDVNVLWRSYVIHIQKTLKAARNNSSEDDGAENREDGEENEDGDVDGEDGEDEELEIFEQLSLDEKIDRLNTFLRSEFNYCFYCGIRYNDQEDLFESCPGDTKEEHV